MQNRPSGKQPKHGDSQELWPVKEVKLAGVLDVMQAIDLHLTANIAMRMIIWHVYINIHHISNM